MTPALATAAGRLERGSWFVSSEDIVAWIFCFARRLCLSTERTRVLECDGAKDDARESRSSRHRTPKAKKGGNFFFFLVQRIQISSRLFFGWCVAFFCPLACAFSRPVPVNQYSAVPSFAAFSAFAFSHVVAFAKNDVNNETVAFLLPYLRRVKSKPSKRTRTGAAGVELYCAKRTQSDKRKGTAERFPGCTSQSVLRWFSSSLFSVQI